MDKQQTLLSLEKSRRNLEFNLQTIKSLIDGKEVANIPSTNKHECMFGVWLYSKDNNLKNLLGGIFFRDLDVYYTQWYDEYTKIYILMFGEVFNTDKKKKITQMDIDKSKLYFSELSQTTDKLLRALNSSKRRLEALAEEKFK